MGTNGTVISLSQYRGASQQAQIDDISAQAFLFLREQAQAKKLPMKSVLLEHLLGISLVIKAVEGAGEAARVLNDLSHQITTAD